MAVHAVCTRTFTYRNLGLEYYWGAVELCENYCAVFVRRVACPSSLAYRHSLSKNVCSNIAMTPGRVGDRDTRQIVPNGRLPMCTSPKNI